MTGSRDKILADIRGHGWTGPELPSLDQAWIRYPDAQQQFAEVLRGVGGRCVMVESAEAAHADLETLDAYRTAQKTASLVPGIGRTTFDLAAVDDPHQLEDVDFAVLPGQVAVAENGAVWVTDEQVSQRVLFFLSQHVALVVPRTQVVHNMHEGAARIELAGRRFGCWISGPSKTADIEQALVIGAHGPRSMTVYLLGN